MASWGYPQLWSKLWMTMTIATYGDLGYLHFRTRPYALCVYTMNHFGHIEGNHTITPAQAKEMPGLRGVYQRCSEKSVVLLNFAHRHAISGISEINVIQREIVADSFRFSVHCLWNSDIFKRRLRRKNLGR